MPDEEGKTWRTQLQIQVHLQTLSTGGHIEIYLQYFICLYGYNILRQLLL